MANISDKKITFTLIFQPMVKGKPRSVTVAGAPDGEMPIIKQGSFPDRAKLIDAIWSELQQRDPQVPHHTAPKSDSKPAKPDEQDDSEPATGPEPPPGGGELVEGPAVGAAPPADLPIINEPLNPPVATLGERMAAQQPASSPLEAAILAAKSEA